MHARSAWVAQPRTPTADRTPRSAASVHGAQVADRASRLSSLGKLTADAQSTVRNEVQTLLNNTIATVQVSAMCTVDFVGHRVVQVLQEIKAELLGRPAPPPEPVVCSSSPVAVEFAAWQQNRVPVVTLTGYDLKALLQVQLVQTTGAAVVPNVLASVSPYQATINLGATGLKLTPQSQKISVQTTASPPVELSGINVIAALKQ